MIHGGKISDHKGINLPNVNLNMKYMSEQDREDILFGIENDVDYIAASFVRSAKDVMTIRNLLDENGGREIRVIAKIESTQGIENFEEILQIADGIMVARGCLLYTSTPGSVSPFGLLSDKDHRITVVLEKLITEAADEELVNFHPNRNTATLSMKKKDFLKFLEYMGTEVIFEESNDY